MSLTDPYQDSYPPSLWETPPGRASKTEQGPEPELPADVEGFTVAQIQEWVTDHPDQAGDVLAAEEARGDDARTTLLDWLTTRTTTDEEATS